MQYYVCSYTIRKHFTTYYNSEYFEIENFTNFQSPGLFCFLFFFFFSIIILSRSIHTRAYNQGDSDLFFIQFKLKQKRKETKA